MKNTNSLRQTFNTQAELYDQIRPQYPDKLFAELIKQTGIAQTDKLLEIGPGTGQATMPLAKLGYEITAIELGADLAKVAKRNLAKYKKVKIITGAFEDINLEPETFALIYSATAFHWIKAEYKFNKPYQLLKPSGHLAIIHTHHVSDEQGDEFFFASQAIYKKYARNEKHDENFRLPKTGNLKADTFDEKLFKPVFFKTYPIVIKYTAQDYAKLLNTYSPTLAMPENERNNFLTDFETLINEKFNGTIRKHFAMSLSIGQKIC